MKDRAGQPGQGVTELRAGTSCNCPSTGKLEQTSGSPQCCPDPAEGREPEHSSEANVAKAAECLRPQELPMEPPSEAQEGARAVSLLRASVSPVETLRGSRAEPGAEILCTTHYGEPEAGVAEPSPSLTHPSLALPKTPQTSPKTPPALRATGRAASRGDTRLVPGLAPPVATLPYRDCGRSRCRAAAPGAPCGTFWWS